MIPERELLWNIGNLKFILYFLAVVVVGFVFYRLYQRIQIWRLGQPVDRMGNPIIRLIAFLRFGGAEGYTHRRFFRDPFAGLMHILIFWGASMLFFGTAVGTIEENVFLPLRSLGIIEWPIGDWYLYSSLAWDIGGLMALAGLSMAVFRRWAIRKPHSRTILDDGVILTVALVLVVSGFTLEALRQLSPTPTGIEFFDHPDWAVWSPGGYVLASLLNVLGLTASVAQPLHLVLWWSHSALVLGAFVYAAYTFSKFDHMWFGPMNMFFRNLKKRGTLPAEPNLETRETFGATSLRDFTWKQLLDTDACTRCARCTDQCPANQTGKTLSPMMVIQNLKTYMNEYGPALRKAGGDPSQVPAELQKKPAGEVVLEEDLWSCVTCGACMEACPVFIEHVPTIVEMRRALVMNEGRVPATAEAALRSLETRGHPWTGYSRSRTEWTEGLDVPTMAAVNPEEIEVLYWVGCAASLEDRSMKIAQAMAKVMKSAKVKFAILGEEESCTGDPARRMGMEYLYEVQAKQNIETLNRYKVMKIVTTCPHCFNTIKNEYPQFNGNFEVVHHTVFLQELVASGRLKLPKASGSPFGVVTYHDPCYLGRHNQVYDEPRELAKAIPGVSEIREMAAHRNRAFCCGAGGGHMWMEDAAGTEKINHRRTQHTLDIGADTIATGCPFCTQMFEDGVKVKNVEEKVRVRDLSEMIAESLEAARPVPAGGSE